MDEIGKILPSLFKKQIRREEPRVLEILSPLWPRIAGEMMARHSQPAAFASGVLTLTTDCATWGTQLKHMTEEIRSRINGFLGQSVVKKLRIKKVNEGSLFSRDAAVVGLPAARSTAIAPKPMDTGSIVDTEVAAALANSYAKYFTVRGREN